MRKPKIINLPLEKGKVYMTRFQVPEPFLLTDISYNKNKEVTGLRGVYQNSPHLGVCPLGADRLQWETKQEGWIEVCPHCKKELE